MKNSSLHYQEFLSRKIREQLLLQAKPVFGLPGLVATGERGGLETAASMNFLLQLYLETRGELEIVLDNRQRDRKFIDERTIACNVYNQKLKTEFCSDNYQTVLGLKDARGRVVVGPLRPDYYQASSEKIAPLPNWLQGEHVTLFGPPDNPKMCLNAMNAYHRRPSGLPEIVDKILSKSSLVPKWGADCEDSKTPLYADLKEAGKNLAQCFDGTIKFADFNLESDHLAQPIKRFTGLAMPCPFLFYEGAPIPMHLYDFALHFFNNWKNVQALAFYVPKLENEEEARYLKNLMFKAEEILKREHPEYQMGSIRLMIVLENPRAVFRVNEIMDELYPYFAGASLGWHDYLASTARLFRHDANYRIPVKSDPDIVIKYIKASHSLVAQVVGARGGIKVGGMYGILPAVGQLKSASFQITLLGFFRDVITQLKRDLNGFWVAHPDFVKIGLSLVEAWKARANGDSKLFDQLVTDLFERQYKEELKSFVDASDIEGLEPHNPLYARSLLVADIGESNIIANNDPEEIRYNVFQTLQYLADWLSGNGCVALPTVVRGEAVRVMDDLATAERSRWQVWHELFHQRFDVQSFIQIAFEEMHFIRKDLSNKKKVVQVKYTQENAKWYKASFHLMIKLMTDAKPVEFATELLLPFTCHELRKKSDPLAEMLKLDGKKYSLGEDLARFVYYFEMCGERKFADVMTNSVCDDPDVRRDCILNFDVEQIHSAAYFHGDIGENKQALDAMAQAEQSGVGSGQSLLQELQNLGSEYKKKFGFKFLVSAKGKSGEQMLALLKQRLEGTLAEEIQQARLALLEITEKRIAAHPIDNVAIEIENRRNTLKVQGLQVAATWNGKFIQSLSFGRKNQTQKVDDDTQFEIASLSKTVGSALALELFEQEGISLETSVNTLFEKFGSDFRLSGKGDQVTLIHLMSHSALNMHYVNGVPLSTPMPPIEKFLSGNAAYGYDPVEVINPPGTKFQYSGAGFIVLEYLLELISQKKFSVLLEEFIKRNKLQGISATHDKNYAWGFKDDGGAIAGTRLQFPLIAAGLMGTAKAVTQFLAHLTQAYGQIENSVGASHNSAVRMLFGRNLGSREFMNCDMGLGVFVAEAGENKLMIHQGANDGYRALFLYCFAGPDCGKGFTLLANGELKAVQLIALVAQCLLKHMNFSGLDFSRFQSDFFNSNLKQEEVVNIGYKTLVFDAFLPDLPEVYVGKERDPLADFNILADSTILKVTDQKFAQAKNLYSDYSPQFDPEFFGRQGKVMDSWETVRHNSMPREELHLRLKKASAAHYILLSTKYHLGNQVESVEIEVKTKKGWDTLLPKTSMDGHAFRKISLENKIESIEEVKIYTYPDGGLTRVGLYAEVPDTLKHEFTPLDKNVCQKFSDTIAQPLKPLSISYSVTPEQVAKNLAQVKAGELVDIASLAFGGKILSASNEHYGPASSVLSPYGPLSMFDGLESARSRKPDNQEEVVIGLGLEAKIERIDLDFTYFVNNNPNSIEILGRTSGTWVPLIQKDWVKPFKGNNKCYEISSQEKFDQIKLRCYPDGGMNRLHVYARK